jgi:hypothetical protein
MVGCRVQVGRAIRAGMLASANASVTPTGEAPFGSSWPVAAKAGLHAVSSSTSAPIAVRREDRKVTMAQFPRSGRRGLSRPTPDGVRTYSARRMSCARAFTQNQRALAMKGAGEHSATARTEWRREVPPVVTRLAVTLARRRATATDTAGVVGRCILVEVGGQWKLSSAPPLPRG